MHNLRKHKFYSLDLRFDKFFNIRRLYASHLVFSLPPKNHAYRVQIRPNGLVLIFFVEVEIGHFITILRPAIPAVLLDLMAPVCAVEYALRQTEKQNDENDRV
jgi:hypothetical protein